MSSHNPASPLSHAPPIPRLARSCAHARKLRPVSIQNIQRAASDASWTRARLLTDWYEELAPRLPRNPKVNPTTTSQTPSAVTPPKRPDHSKRARAVLKQAMSPAPTPDVADALVCRATSRAVGKLVAVRFAWTASAQRGVSVVGSFNGWGTPIALRRTENDAAENLLSWSRVVRLPAGTHTYRFCVDGRWMVDSSRRVVVLPGRGKVNEVCVGSTRD